MADRDPVARTMAEREDLYDVAEWDPRSALDRGAVVLYRGLHASRDVLLVGLALVLFFLQLAAAGLIFLQRPEFGVLAALSAIPAFLLVAYVWWDDPTRREPVAPLAITFVLAVLFASFAAVINTAFSGFLTPIPYVGTVLFFFLVVGPVEETVKWLAIRVYAFDQDSFSAVIDGAVYGAVAGLGFATIENAIYIAQSTTRAVGELSQLQVVVQTATSRALVGPGHVLYSAFAGYYLGLAKFNPDRAGPIVVKGIVIAAVIHATYNTLVSTIPFTAFPVPVLAFLGFVVLFDGIVAYALYRKLSRYKRYYRRADEETPGDPDRAAANDGDAADAG